MANLNLMGLMGNANRRVVECGGVAPPHWGCQDGAIAPHMGSWSYRPRTCVVLHYSKVSSPIFFLP